jgi:general secretion pathway protein G
MLHKLRAAKAEESGFTLVELLLVITILGVLAGVVVFSVGGFQQDSQTQACKAEAATVNAAVEGYYAKNKTYPTAWTGLTSGSSKLLHSAPTMVDFGSGHTSSNLVLAWAGACTTTSGLPTAP